MKPKKGETRTLEIRSLDARGRGIGQDGEYLWTVQGAIPGDRVLARARRVRHRQRLVEARCERVLDVDVSRVPARCPHLEVCGGCLWQDVPYDHQVQLKEEMLRAVLDEAGVETPLEATIPCSDPFYYRNKMEFSFASSEENGLRLGLHHAGSFDRVFDLDACVLQSETSNRVVDFVRDFSREKSLSAYHLRDHTGLLRFLTVREGKQTGEMMVCLTTSGEPFESAQALGQALVEEFPEVRSVVQIINRRKAQVATGDEEIVLAGASTVSERLGDFRFEISPGSFFQTNTKQAERLYELVLELSGVGSEDRVLDLYCGTGAISLFLARHVREVVGIELSNPSVQNAARNVLLNDISNCRFISGTAEQVLQQLRIQGEEFTCAVTDPPRPGMHRKALSALCQLKPRRIIYVSCNPAALAADLSFLVQAGYDCDYVQPVDMFPHTPHCETVARVVAR